MTPSDTARSDVRLSDVRVPKASDVLAQQLRDSILSGEISTGMTLPSERHLVVSSGLSRVSVREALRILELEGLVRTRPGRNGGAVVSRPGADTMTRTIDVFIRGGRTSLRSLIEVRAAIEPAAAGLATEHASPDEVAELVRLDQRQHEVLDDPTAYMVGATQWHLAIARASRNEYMAAFMASIAAAIFTAGGTATTAAARKDGLLAHDRIVAAIESRDADAAVRRMRRHLVAYDDLVEHLPLPGEISQ